MLTGSVVATPNIGFTAPQTFAPLVSRVVASPLSAPYPTAIPNPITVAPVVPQASITGLQRAFVPAPQPFILPNVNTLYQSNLGVASVAPISAPAVAVPGISTVAPYLNGPQQAKLIAPTSVLGTQGFSSGGFSLLGDADTITPGYQTAPGIVSATGLTQIF